MRRVIGWPADVNQKIIDQTSITIGENGYFEDSASNGSVQERRLSSLYTPDSFNVVMDFNWLEKDENGESEFDRFEKWYKYEHQRGVHPFEFPAITKFNILGSLKTCQYKITSPITPTKSGFCMRVNMTWKEVFSGIINITKKESVPKEIIFGDTVHISLVYSETFTTLPLVGDFKLYFAAECEHAKTQEDLIAMAKEIGPIDAEKIGYNGREAKSVYIWFPELTENEQLMRVDIITKKKMHHFYVWLGDPESEDSIKFDYWA